MKERPIIFSAPMVKALLDGRKTQTRRIVKPQGPLQPECWDNCIVQLTNGHSGRGFYVWDEGYEDDGSYLLKCPYGKPGDRLWVKETHAMLYQKSECPVIAYRADDSARIVFNPPEGNFTLAGQAGEAASTWRAEQIRWKPSLFMPRWASRITLEITDVRVQRVEEISEEDAGAEGIQHPPNSLLYTAGGDFFANANECFLDLFYDINKRAKRGTNPWVWALTFKVVKS